MRDEQSFLKIVQSICNLTCLIVVILAGAVIYIVIESKTIIKTTEKELSDEIPIKVTKTRSAEIWKAPDSTKISLSPDSKLIEYGRELVTHTALYLGPQGKVNSISNGMNCQNCHLKSGTKPFGNNYAAVASTYPKFRARSGTVESIEKRVNDCVERSLNGQKLDDGSREMKAFVAYISWVGKDVQKGLTPKGSGIWDLQPLHRAADPGKGKFVYANHCERCHGNGQGVKTEDGKEWKYPPLFGDESYSVGAGLFRLSRFAGFVKMNMPHGTTYENPLLTDEEAWDVAAFVNSLPRPSKDISKDWPDISKKPFDHPFGPYADNFSEKEHKYGPFLPIREQAKR